MPFSKLYRAALVVLGLAVPAFALAPARADPATPQAEATAKDKLAFKVCRIPGLDAETNNQTIEIPAGTEYAEGHPSLDNPVTDPLPKPQPGIVVVTTKAQSLPATGFCVTVPAKPRGNVDEATIRANLGEMFEPNGNWRDPATVDPIVLTYGYWVSNQD